MPRLLEKACLGKALAEVGENRRAVVAVVHHTAVLQQQHPVKQAEGLDGGAVDGGTDGDALLLLQPWEWNHSVTRFYTVLVIQ